MNWRKVRRNESSQIPRTLLFVDCETQDSDGTNPKCEKHRLWFGCATGGRLLSRKHKTIWGCTREFVFREKSEFWRWVKEMVPPNETGWIFAHNAGFDFTVLGVLELIRNGDWWISKPRAKRNGRPKDGEINGLLMLDDPPTIIGLECESGQRIVLVDTLNYWRVSLKALGKSIGLEKLDMPAESAPMSEWWEYCLRDVKIIETAIVGLIRWWRERDLGNWKWTTPSLAMSAFRHKFCPENLVYHDEQPVRALERESYFGGQLEAFYMGEIGEPVWQYDVVSLYPSVMANHEYPSKLVAWDTSAELTEVKPPIQTHASICEVELDTPGDTFPVRTRDGVCYANGRGVVTLAGPELAYAEIRGFIKRWGRWATYTMCDLFTGYVEYFYELKDEYARTNQHVRKGFCKLLLNSLYGKFGQRGGKWQFNPERMPFWDYGLFREIHPFTGETTKCLSIWDVVMDYKPREEVEQAAPSICAFVTAYARQKMRRLRQIAGSKSVYYQSTDSLIVNSKGRDLLRLAGGVIGDGLGQLKEENHADTGWIGGLHWYRIGDKTVEGSKKLSAKPLTTTKWEELQFDSLLSVIQRSHEHPRDMDSVYIHRVEKERRLGYTKGHVGSNGWVTAYTFSELHK